MSAKPGTVCKLVKGKLIDAQPNFVDTFNWLVDCMANLKGEDSINVTGVNAGTPVVKLKPIKTSNEEGDVTINVEPDTPTPGPVQNLDDDDDDVGTDKNSIHNLVYRPATHQLVAIRADGAEFVVFTATPVSEG